MERSDFDRRLNLACFAFGCAIAFAAVLTPQRRGQARGHAVPHAVDAISKQANRTNNGGRQNG